MAGLKPGQRPPHPALCLTTRQGVQSAGSGLLNHQWQAERRQTCASSFGANSSAATTIHEKAHKSSVATMVSASSSCP